jgi:tRNA(Ile)-lysidine synthase
VTKNRALKSRIINHLVESNLIKQNDKIVVAVSGGMDSMFLLYMLIELRKIWDIELVIGHVNHNIRLNSIHDEKFVVKRGRKFKIPVIVKQLNYDDKKSSESTEAWARNNRYAQLELIRKENNYDKVATGHHSNDQIETILQRISEKSGIGGLKGIHKQRGTIIRPILTISKADIERVVNDLQIKYVDDETNKNLVIPRNYFRHQIIPQWESLYPNLGKSIQSICESAVENQSVIDYFIEKLDDFEILKDRQDWIIRYKFKVNLQPINVRLNDAVHCGVYVFKVRKVKKYLFTDNPNIEIINGDEIVNNKLVLRPWQNGDTFKPLGMQGKKKISDFLTDEKINQFEKENQLVLTANDEIIWLCGRRISDTVKITKDTKHFLELSMNANVG